MADAGANVTSARRRLGSYERLYLVLIAGALAVLVAGAWPAAVADVGVVLVYPLIVATLEPVAKVLEGQPAG